MTRRKWALVLLAVVLSLMWFWEDPALEAVLEVSAPAVRAPAPLPLLPLPPVVPPAPEVAELHVWVQLADPARWSPIRPNPHTHRPWLYWPDRDDVDWPDLATTDAMEALVTTLRSDFEGSIREALVPFVDAAQADGLLPLPERGFDDPWTGLMAAQAAYAAAFAAEELSSEEAYAQLADRQRLAAQIVAEWPDHLASDYARLLLLNGDAWLDVAAEEGFPRPEDVPAAAAVRAEAYALLERCDDPEMVGEAAAWLAATGDAPLDLLEEVIDRTGQYAPIVADGALGIAVRAGQWEEALAWADTIGDGSATEWARAAADVAGYRAATGWRASLTAEVMRCAGSDLDLESVVFEVTGGQWRVRGADSAFAECMAGFVPPDDGPTEAVVTVTVSRSA